MKEKINVFDYAEQLNKALPQGILLNTSGDKFNTMVIGWGQLGTLWNLPTYTVYVRQSRYTKPQLDKTKEFTISAPVSGKLDREVFRICGTQSGRDVDKEKAANLTLVAADEIQTPGIKEYPLTLECRVRSWDPEIGYLIGEIVASQADESILTDGKVDLGKLKPIIFDPSFNVYRVVGEAVGNAFRDGLKLK